MNEKYRYLGKNTLIFAISTFGTKFLSFLLVPLYTNVLSTAEYGTADIIVTTATLLIYIFTINISDAVLRYAIDCPNSSNSILSYGVKVLRIGSLLCLSAIGIIIISGKINWPFYYYIFVFLIFFFTALYQILANYMRGIDKISQVAIAGIISSVAIIISNILFLLIVKIGVIGYLIAFVAGPFIASLYCILVIKEPIYTYFINSCHNNIARKMRVYSFPLIFNNIALWINGFLDRYFITGMCGAADNGVYSIASKIPIILATFYTVFSQAWNLSAIKEFDPADKDGFFSNTYSVYFSTISIVCSVLILLNIPLARLLYAKEFFGAWQYSSILLLSVLFNSLTIFIGSIFSAVKKTKTIAYTTIVSAVMNTLLNIILIPKWGALGAAIATAVAYLVMFIARVYISHNYIKLTYNHLKGISIICLIVCQIILEHTHSHMYLAQMMCVLLVFGLTYRDLITFFKHIRAEGKA